jgi:DNA-binding response OmpR family regulator
MSKILVVDDEEEIRFLLAKFLKVRKHDAILASSGEEGLEAAVKHRPDAIILDICMPGTDGLDVLRQLKETAETLAIPVIMLTGVAGKEPLKEAMYWYAEQYLTKPFAEVTLSAAIERVLAYRKKRTAPPTSSGESASDAVPD